MVSMIRKDKTIQGCIILLIFFVAGCSSEPNPPDPNTVAIFVEGTITRQEVKETVDQLNDIFKAEDKHLQQFNNKKAYRDIIEGIALDRMIKKKITDLKLDKRKDFTHAMKHISEELDISELHTRAHDRQIKISEEQIRAKFDQDQSKYGEATLSQVSEIIRSQLEAEVEQQYFTSYMAELRKNAVIKRYDDLLKVPDPTDAEVRMFFEQNRSTYSGDDFDTASPLVMEDILVEKSRQWFRENRNRTLVTIHGKRFTVGEFRDEIEELPRPDRDLYQSYDSMKMLLDKMIDRMLVVEDTYDQMLSSESRDERGHIKEELLRQVFHQEEVDDQVKISEEEIATFFSENSKAFVRPPRVQINYLRISGGQTDTDRDLAEQKIKEAYKKLKPGLFKKGALFSEIAMEYSEDPETAKNGGSIEGWITESSEFLEEIADHGFHENVLGLDEKDISRPFMFEGSYYIVQVREREGQSLVDLDEARETIRSELETLKHEEMTLQLEKNLLDQAKLIIFNKTIETMLKEREEG